ncbi:Prolactin receptor [Sparganum proliferum]
MQTVRSKKDEVKNVTLAGENEHGGSTEAANSSDEEEPKRFRFRGRRAAFVDTKTEIGEIDDNESPSNNNLLTETVKNPSCSEEPSCRMFESDKNSKNVLQNQQSADELHPAVNAPIKDIWKSTNQSLLKLIERKSKVRESTSAIVEALKKLKPSVFHDKYLEKYVTSQRNHLTVVQNQSSFATPLEQKRLEALWELFLSEVTFLSEHIMVLKHCFSEPLKSIQVEGHLIFVEPSELFGNLDELCYVSYVFCRDLLDALVEQHDGGDNAKPSAIIQPMLRWSEHAKDGEIFHDYCLNYDSALTALERLRKDEQFQEFERWCSNDPRCRRLQLTDLLIAPLQHYAKIPLLLGNIRRYTEDEQERRELTQALGKVETSLRHLEEKMTWLQNLDRLQALQKQIIWPNVLETDPRVFIPEFLRKMLSHQPCEMILANPKRKLVYEGVLSVNDAGRFQEMYAFLFDDFLLFTRVKKAPKKKLPAVNTLISRSPTEGGLYVVHKQPIALDRCTIHNVGAAEAAVNGLKHSFVVISITRFQQITDVYTVQAGNEVLKNTWLEQLSATQINFQMKLKEKLDEIRGSEICTNKHSKLIYVTPPHQATVRCHLTLPDFEDPKLCFANTTSSVSSPGDLFSGIISWALYVGTYQKKTPTLK